MAAQKKKEKSNFSFFLVNVIIPLDRPVKIKDGRKKKNNRMFNERHLADFPISK
jgi:hypothetical protein